MGLDLSFQTADEELSIRLSNTDWQIFGMLGKGYRMEVDAIAGVDDFGEPRIVGRLDLLHAVEVMLGRMESETDLIPYVYGHTIREGLAAGVSGTGTIGGIRIGGDGFSYALIGGLGRCILEKWGAGPDGKGILIEKRDIRQEKSIKSDNYGTIEITRKKKSTSLKKALVELKEFLTRHQEETVTKILG
jgi:hypothetical protein